MFDRKRPGVPGRFFYASDFSTPRNLCPRIPARGSGGESGSEDSRGVLPGGMWPLKVSCYLYIQPVTKLSFSRVFLRALARRLNFEMTVFSGVFQKYHSVDRPQENVGFI